MVSHWVLWALLQAVASLAAPTTAQSDCTAFANAAQLSEFNGQVLNATHFSPNTRNITLGTLNISNDIPFCEIFARISYGAANNNTLTFALWLPDNAHYSSRFMAVGNGGMAGTIDTYTMMTQLNSRMGFAVAGGDAGHSATDNNDGAGESGVYLPYLHDAEQVQAWIHNAISIFAPAARALTEGFYRCGVRRSFYYGCSTGGAQGFALAQFHPEMFDGIVAGSPGNWYSHLALSFLWNAQATDTPATNLAQEVLNFTATAVLDACDSLDGVTDRLIENPLLCNFSIDSLACSPGSSKPCLTPSQISAFKAIYAGPVRSDTGKQLYPGFTPSSEIEWLLQEGPLAEAFTIPILQNLVFDDLHYNADTFNWASDVDALNRNAGRHIDAINPDLTSFRDSGGKLLVTQGWADPYNAATWPIEHLARVEEVMGGDVRGWFEVFMVPGGGHCGAASFYPGVPAVYESVEALVGWVEEGKVPEGIRSKEPPDGSGRTRKLCAWPRNAVFEGGDVDDWESYTCA